MISERNNNMVTGSSIEDVRLGRRIECCGYMGTIKYIGPVTGYKGLWLGIDWDDTTRGKHNGAVDQVEYFKASHLRSGSFIRCEKANFGQTIVSAIFSKYGQCDNIALGEQVLLAFQQSTNTPFLEVVGFDKVAKQQSNFHELQIVDLRMCNISAPDIDDKLRLLCPNIIELDLSKNLLSSWSDVFAICNQLNSLNTLQVSYNLMHIPDNYESFQFTTVKILICAYMKLNWSDLRKITHVFNCVEQLIVPYNEITSIEEIDAENVVNLWKIDLEGNRISWKSILKLDSCVNLNEINLTSTQIDLIRLQSGIFKQLRKLCISRNEINDWQSISELNKLHKLEDLRFLFNPVLNTESLETNMQICVAKVANLKILNGSEIDLGFRKGAEYDYLKKYGLEWLQVKETTEKRAQFLHEHNRYLELVEKYGCLEESELKQQSNKLNSTLICIKLVYGDRIITKKFPPTLLVQKLIMLCQKLFKLSERPKLVCRNDETNVDICLDDEMKEIDFYSIQDGDKLIVQL